MVNIAFMVNPLAGYGGKLNYKGSDGLTLPDLKESVSIKRALDFLHNLKKDKIKFYVPSGAMGSGVLDTAGITEYEVIFRPGSPTTAEDTRDFVKLLSDYPIDLLLFVGGDGTARDILSSLNPGTPVMGIPAGVKMYSSVFAISTGRAADFINSAIESDTFEMEK